VNVVLPFVPSKCSSDTVPLAATTLCALVAVCASLEPIDAVNELVAAAVGVPLRTSVLPTMLRERPAGRLPEATPVPPVSEYGDKPPTIAKLDE
jgi:hypothetical protein